MSYSTDLADVNNDHRLGRITEPERTRKIFEIRDKYENQVQVITDPAIIFDTFERDQEAEDSPLS